MKKCRWRTKKIEGAESGREVGPGKITVLATRIAVAAI